MTLHSPVSRAALPLRRDRRHVHPTVLAAGLLTLVALGACSTAPEQKINNYPTLDRVHYVQDCMRQHPGPRFEMESKCSCTLDRLAETLSYDDFTTFSTAANATSIGGERGGVMRDNELVQSEVKRWREAQASAKKACFINTDGPR